MERGNDTQLYLYDDGSFPFSSLNLGCVPLKFGSCNQFDMPVVAQMTAVIKDAVILIADC